MNKRKITLKELLKFKEMGYTLKQTWEALQIDPAGFVKEKHNNELIHKVCGNKIYAQAGQGGFYCSGCDMGWPDDIDIDNNDEIEEVSNE